MSPEMIGNPAMWAQFGALALVCGALFALLGFVVRWILNYILKREDRYAEETRRRDEAYVASLNNIMSLHEKTSASIVNSLDRLAIEVRENGKPSRG